MGHKIQVPFLKWVGGKTQLIDKIIDKIPKRINNYHEIFIGGGSVLFAVLSLCLQKKIIIKNKIYAYDINELLINTYKHIQKNKDKLHEYLVYYFDTYHNIVFKSINRKAKDIEEALSSKESYYYWIRSKFNKCDKTKIKSSAMFIFLNKTCFRGLYREGPNGFNVPYGHYKKTPKCISKNEIDMISKLIKDVIFINSDFNESIQKIKSDDFVYLDPPYAPENSNSFVNYTKNGFDLDTHKILFNKIIEFDEQNIKFLLSNVKVKLVTEYFKNFECEELISRRSINSKNPASTTIEVLISN